MCYDVAMTLQLGNTKSADQKKTLLHYLVETIESNFPELLSFQDELIHVEQASKGLLQCGCNSVVEDCQKLRAICGCDVLLCVTSHCRR